ncbi:ABC transporter substrate-binding protein [Rubrimonas sp.]|uniref:ABC transporter substrate-binding protein n=1 Tax=Rubrimonas sp. TaxID=2036015 RepID=UPI002FDDF410
MRSMLTAAAGAAALTLSLNAGGASAQATIAPPPALAERGYITYCATLDNPPRAFFDDQVRPTGFEVELGEAIAERMGLRVEWTQLRFVGLIPALQAGQCDALMQELFIREERLEIIDMIPFSNTGQRLVSRTDNDASPEDLDALSGVKVGVPNGTTIHNLAEEANMRLRGRGQAEIDLVVLPTTTDTFRLLSTGQLDLVGTTMTAAAYYVGLQPDQFRFAGEPFGLIGTGIGIDKGQDALTAAMTAAFEAVVADGTYAALIEKYSMQGSEL